MKKALLFSGGAGLAIAALALTMPRAEAPANTREAIFDAMIRREVYVTTGPRISVRMFAGWNFAASVFARDWVKTAYANGVPMGGNVTAGKGVPSFIVQALQRSHAHSRKAMA